MVITTARLLENVSGGRVVFDRHGEPVDFNLPADVGEAVLVVAPVTDAVKRVNDSSVESLDRDELWVVVAVVLAEPILKRVDATFDTTDDLLEAVRDLGYTWTVSPVSSP